MIFRIGDGRERLTENIIIDSYILLKKMLDVRFMFFDDPIDETSRAGAACITAVRSSIVTSRLSSSWPIRTSIYGPFFGTKNIFAVFVNSSFFFVPKNGP